MSDFFDKYPVFLEGSVGAHPNRLRNRHKAIIEANSEIIEGQSILDLGSHDGRWSLAAHVAGAQHVVGVECRSELVTVASQILLDTSIPIGFHTGDAIKFLRITDLPFTTIFCLGFLYHTPFHYEIFESFHRIQPKHIILDTKVANDTKSFVNYARERIDSPGKAISLVPGKSSSVVGMPSVGYIKLMAEYFDFQIDEIDWHGLGIKDWARCKDYKHGTRRTYLLTNVHR